MFAGKSRGYAFVEYEDKKDMKEAYKAADGRKIEGRRILVDVERGRTVESWWVAAWDGRMVLRRIGPRYESETPAKHWVKL